MSESTSNSRGIPKAPFVEDVEAYMKNEDRTVDLVLREFAESISKYRFMEANIIQRKVGLEDKIPEIKKSYDMVLYLIGKKSAEEPIKVDYELNDTLYAKAVVQPTEKINLWLGANIMVEYTLDEAKELLENKLNLAKKSLQTTKEDLGYLRDQITTMEVNTARIYNWDVKMRREAKNKSN